MPLSSLVCFLERVAMTVIQMKYFLQTSAWLRPTMSNVCWHAFEHNLLGKSKTLVEINKKEQKTMWIIEINEKEQKTMWIK